MELNPCQVMIDGQMCGKLEAKPESFRIDSSLYGTAYQNGRNIVEVWVCKDCHSRMHKEEPKKSVKPVDFG